MTDPWWLPALWILNGFLLVLFMLGTQWMAVLSLPGLVRLVWPARDATRPDPQRPWGLAAALLTLTALLLAPRPVPLMLLLMVGSGTLALRLEAFAPQDLRWRVTQGLALYALMALGFWLFEQYLALAVTPDPASALLMQGQSYLLVIASLALWGYPLGFLALLAQSLFAQPPVGSPEGLLTTIRTRGKE
jgi:hypothetical protein